MLLKLGVDISRLHDSIRTKLSVIDSCMGEEAVITSTYEGAHSAGSLHYQNKAIDIRFPKKLSQAGAVTVLTAKLGEGYDVVLEATHIHVEYDPK